MKIILVGCGRIGSTLAEELANDGHDLTLIDPNGDKLERLSNYLDLRGLQGSGASHQIQLEAGVEDADLLIATTAEDEVNLLCCLMAKRAGVQHVIARVRNPLYVKDIRFLREEMGLSMIISPEMVTAQEISHLIRFPSAIKVETFSKGQVELLQIELPQGSPVHGRHISDVGMLLKTRILICMVEREGQFLIPNGSFVLRSGDRITAIVPPGHTQDFFACLGVTQSRIRSVVLAGGGRTAHFLARILLDEGFRVKIIERRPERAAQLSELLPEVTVILGDCTSKELLQEEVVNATDCLVSLTDMDEENIMLSLYLRTTCSVKTITNIHHITFDEVIAALPLDSVVYSKEVAAVQISRYVRAMQNSMGSNIETLHRFHGGAEALEFHVQAGSPVIGVPLQALPLKKNLLICSITHQGKTIAPRGSDVIQAGDSVIIFTTITGLNDLNDILL